MSTDVSEEHVASIFSVEERVRNQYEIELCLLYISYWFSPEITLQPWYWSHVPPKCRFTFTGLYPVVSQETELFKRAIFYSCIQPYQIMLPSESTSYRVRQYIMAVLQCRDTTITRGPGRVNKYGSASTTALSGKLASPLVTNDEPQIYVINIPCT
jgi:hypothetical protein